MITLFISYSYDDDKPFIKRIYEDLRRVGFDVWWDQMSMSARGRTLPHEIREAIRKSDRLIVVFGPGAVSSQFVKAEWSYA